MSQRIYILDRYGNPMMSASNTPYESAGTGRRAVNWYAPGTGPNATLGASLTTLRNRSRAGYRNNPWIKRGLNSLTANEIGTGITPRSRAADDQFRRAANALWETSAQEFDADGVLDVYGMQSMSSLNRNQAGEVFIRRRPRRPDDGLAVPLQVQILEAEFVPEGMNQIAPNGNVIRNGIEFDRVGRRAAYWMYRQHPADNQVVPDTATTVRVPASEVIHHYLPIRPGQIRGEPVTAQALLKAHTFDSYDDAELVRKQTRAPFTGFLKKSYEGETDWQYDPMTGEPTDEDHDGMPTANVEAGTWLSGLPGEEPVLFSGDDTGQGYADFMRQQLLGIAAGIGPIPYELLSGDWSKVNDRLIRAILQEFRRQIEAWQDQLMIFQVCRTWWHWWMDAAVYSGALTAPGYTMRKNEYRRHEWRPQGWQYLHPEQDINAKSKAIDKNLTSTEAEVAKAGYDIEDIIDQNIRTEQLMVQKRREAGLPDYPPNSAKQQTTETTQG